MNPLPVVLCGKSAHVAVGVKEGIRPAYEVLHFITSVQDGVRDIPFLLQGLAPPSKEWANLGTQNYGTRVAAIVVGGGYSTSDLEKFRNACKGKSNIPWLHHDLSSIIDPNQPRPKVGIEYGEQLSLKILKLLNQLRDEGKMTSDGVYDF